MLRTVIQRGLSAVVALSFLTACGAASQVPRSGVAEASTNHSEIVKSMVRRTSSPASGVIQHVVFIVQENRSFNNLFNKYPGATTQDYGYDLAGAKIKLQPITLATGWDIDHSVYAFLTANNNGKNNGWGQESTGCGFPYCQYGFVPKGEVKPYWDMAKNYVLGDQMFQSHLDGSFIAHQYAIAAYANHEVDFPSGDWGCEGGPYDYVPTLNQDRSVGSNVEVCEDYPTLGDLLDGVGVSWRFYTPSLSSWNLWSSYSAINHIYNGPDWANVISPPAQFISDVQNGKLAQMNWIVPTWQNSDHAGAGSKTGPAWVTSLVNAVGNSQYWNSTQIFIVWDDWGGWYDPVLPIYKDYDGLGYRIPILMISPYAKQGVVTHVQYEMASVLRFAEDLWGTTQLAAADARAADPANDPALDFTQAPRPFKSFAAGPYDHSESRGPKEHVAAYGD